MPALFKAAKVFFHGTHSDADKASAMALLEKIAATEEFAFQFVFFQKSGAPRTWSRVYSPESKKGDRHANPLLTYARIDRDKALALYAECMTKYGPGEAWIDHDPVEEMSESEMPPMYF